MATVCHVAPQALPPPALLSLDFPQLPTFFRGETREGDSVPPVGQACHHVQPLQNPKGGIITPMSQMQKLKLSNPTKVTRPACS